MVRLALVAALVAGLAYYAPWRALTEAADVPPGWRLYRTDLYHLAHPADWKVVEGRDRNGRAYVEINGPATSSGAHSGQIRVVRSEHGPNALRDQLVQFRSAAPDSRYRVDDDRPVLVDKAGAAHRFEISYRTRTPLGHTVAMRATETFILTDEQVLLDFAVRSSAEKAADSRTNTIVGSFRLREDRGILPKIDFGS